jgi:predicted membrane channel-forming protein YqfA (hemolysin III family)
MDKKNEKGNGMCVTIGFWVMIVLFVAMMAMSMLKLQWPSLIVGILFVISVFFVFVMSIKAIVPQEKSMAYIALAIAILFILYVLLSATVSASSSVLG